MSNPLQSAYVAPAIKFQEQPAPAFSAVAFSSDPEGKDTVIVKVGVLATPAFKAAVAAAADGAPIELRYQIAKTDLIAGAAAFVSVLRTEADQKGR